jgi:hypothetical protein
MPFSGGDARAALDFGQDGEEAFGSVGWQRDGLSEGVDVPAEDCFPGAPISVPFEQFLLGNGFGTKAGAVCVIVGAENGIVDVEEDVAQPVKTSGGTLPEDDLIVNVDVGVRQRLGGQR